MADGRRRFSARHDSPMGFTARFLLAQSLLLTGPLFSKLLDGLQIHNPIACGAAPPL